MVHLPGLHLFDAKRVHTLTVLRKGGKIVTIPLARLVRRRQRAARPVLGGLRARDVAIRNGHRSEPFFTHTWVERDGWLLDITADQFTDITTPVLPQA